jgi:membrane protease YdiL (CAAX protease family)
MISAVLFAFLHAVYLDPLTGLLSFAAGIMWSIIYQRIPNLAGVSLSHAIIGIMAIMAGIARKI